MGFAHVRALIALLLLASPAAAHEIGTTRVNAQFLRDHTYVIEIATPLDGLERRHAMNTPALQKSIDVIFDDVRVRPSIALSAAGATANIRLSGPIPVRVRTFRFRYGLTFASYAMTAEGRTQWVNGDEATEALVLSPDVVTPSRLDVIRQYLVLGFTHIVPRGLDHILFVLGIFLLSMKLRPVLTQVTAFTIAHSITLGLSMYGVVSVSSRIVEPMIALSIVYVAIENMTTTKLRRSRVAIVFAFGLLHGLGFAGVLRELGLPRAEFLTALVSFNAGVEAGQLTVIAGAYAALGWWSSHRPVSIAIAGTGLFWAVQRIAF